MMDSPLTDTLNVNRKELLKFCDEKHGAEKGDATGVVAVVGEDLNAAVFQHYAASRGDHVAVVPRLDKAGTAIGLHPVTTGKPRGPWLDRWLQVKPYKGRRFLYQTEIKNWSAHALNGEILAFNAADQDVADYKQRRWERHWDSEHLTLKGLGTAKVLVPMERPEGCERMSVRPLLIFWEALGPKETVDDHLFSVPVTDNFPFEKPQSWQETGKFDKLSIFSVSSYLRSLTQDQIQLQMPNAARRIQVLNRLFSLDS